MPTRRGEREDEIRGATPFRGFDEAQLVRELERLPRQLRVGFACACAERLLPAYDAFVSRTGRGDPAVFARSLARLWADLVGEHPLEESEVQALIEACMSQIPKEDDQPWVTEQAAAEDAGAAVAYALRCRQNGLSVLRRKGPRFEEILKTIPPSGLKFLKRIPPSPA